MKRLILAALALAAFGIAAPAAAQTQDVQAQRAQRRAEMQQRMEQRRAELVQRRTERLKQLAERRPELKQQIEERLAKGVKVRPARVRKVMMQRRINRMKTLRPEMFDRLDLNKDGVLSRDEWQPRVRRKI